MVGKVSPYGGAVGQGVDLGGRVELLHLGLVEIEEVDQLVIDRHVVIGQHIERRLAEGDLVAVAALYIGDIDEILAAATMLLPWPRPEQATG